MSSQDKHLYEFGPFRLDPRKRRLLRDGEPVSLTPKAFDTLFVLVMEGGRSIEKDDLMKRVWPDAIVEENNLTQNITALRKVLGDTRQESRYIATIPGYGYRFVEEVRKVTEDEEATPEVATLIGQALPSTQPPPQQTQTRSSSRNRAARVLQVSLLALTALVLVAVVYVLFTREKRETETSGITSIAVLPLENISGDPSQEYFADGMTDTLIGDLAKINELRVISRTSSMHYKGIKKSLPVIAKELKVDAVVEGTVQRVGERVRVRAQLIRAATDQHLWVETYDRDMRDIFAMQSEIAQAIAQQVQITLSPSEHARLLPRKPVNPKAFDYYLQGRYLYWNKRTEENLNKAIEYFESSIREDSNYALPYAALSDSYNAMATVQIGLLPPIEARARAEAAALKALERDSGLAEAHNALGVANHYNWKWNEAEQQFRRAIELNPSYAPAHLGYASYLMSLGRVDESINAANRSRELDPLSLSISVQRGFLLENARRYDEAIEQLNRVIAVDQNHYQALWVLGHTYAANKQYEQAIGAAEKAVAVSQRAPGALGMLGLVYGLAGRKSEATKVLNELLNLSKNRYVTPAAFVNVYIGLGNKEEALAWLEKAYQERSNFTAYLKVFPIVDPLRTDPRFVELTRRIGLPQ